MSEIKFTPSIPLVFRENLSFHAEDLGSERTKESFDSGVETAEVADLTKGIVLQSLDLLDKKYWPKEIGIDFETWGRMYWPDGSMEELPISLIVSQQRPKDSRIRLGMHEILKDRDAQSSIIAHEMGHMLVEWAGRKAGVVDPTKSFMDLWSKPIYEGVADWVAAVVTGSTIIGSNATWFSRNILAYDSLKDAREKSFGAMPVLLERGLNEMQLPQKYRAYREWLELVKKYLGDKPDPYAEGQWIAGELWKISDKQNQGKRVFGTVIDLLVSGKKMDNPEEFILLVSKGRVR
jgi:hypothetical protein